MKRKHRNIRDAVLMTLIMAAVVLFIFWHAERGHIVADLASCTCEGYPHCVATVVEMDRGRKAFCALSTTGDCCETIEVAM